MTRHVAATDAFIVLTANAWIHELYAYTNTPLPSSLFTAPSYYAYTRTKLILCIATLIVWGKMETWWVMKKSNCDWQENSELSWFMTTSKVSLVNEILLILSHRSEGVNSSGLRRGGHPVICPPKSNNFCVELIITVILILITIIIITTSIIISTQGKKICRCRWPGDLPWIHYSVLVCCLTVI